MNKMVINLQEFLDGYKQSEVELGNKKRIFREPKMKDMKMPIQEMLRKYCIEGNADEFLDIVNNQLTKSQQKECIKGILEELGLV